MKKIIRIVKETFPPSQLMIGYVRTLDVNISRPRPLMISYPIAMAYKQAGPQHSPLKEDYWITHFSERGMQDYSFEDERSGTTIK